MMAQANRTPLQTSFILGLIFGVGLGIGQIALLLLLFLIAPYSYTLAMLLVRILPVATLLAYFFAGFRTTRQTGQLFTGTIAGALTGVFSVATLLLWISLITSLWQGQTVFLTTNVPVFIPLDLSSNPYLNAMINAAVNGAVVGTVGGFIGRLKK
jgi:hypothetical protein